MSEPNPISTPQVIPYLYYADVPGAMQWLQRVFGVEKGVLASSGPDRHHGEVHFGRSTIMMGTAGNAFGSAPPARAGVRTGGVFVYLASVDEHFARAKAAGAEIVRELADAPYGRTYWARDPEGHDWFFTQPPT